MANFTRIADAATVAERDQIMGHAYSGIFQFYINPRIKCDVQAAFLEEPSDKALMKVMGGMSLTSDPNAPKGLSKEESRAIANHPKIVELRQRRDALTAKIRKIRNNSGPFADAKEESLIQQREEAEAALRRRKKRLRDRAEANSRKMYFLNNDTKELEEQCEDPSLYELSDGQATTATYQLEERARIAEILCSPYGDLTEPENLDQRIDLIRNLTKLCSRREARRRNTRPYSPVEVIAKEEDVAISHSFPLDCDPRQCLFCIGDERLPYQQRLFCWSRPAKMMDHIEDKHLQLFAPDSKIPCPHPKCKEGHVALNGVLHFKNHAQTVHQIKLRLPKVDSI